MMYNIQLIYVTPFLYGYLFHKMCKLIDKNCQTSYGFSSLLIYTVPVFLMNIHNTMSVGKYILVTTMSGVSFYFHVIREKHNDPYLHIVRCLDNSLVLLASLLYITKNQYILLLTPTFFLHYKLVYPDTEIHSIIMLISMIKLLLNKPFLIFIIFPGIYSIYNIIKKRDSLLQKYIWHISSSIGLGYTLS